MILLVVAAVMFVIGINLFVYIPSQSQVCVAQKWGSIKFELFHSGQICITVNECVYGGTQPMPAGGDNLVHLPAQT